MQSSAFSLDKGREQYIKALTLISDRKNGLKPRDFATYLAELGMWEAQSGDWKCGHDNVAVATATYDRLTADRSDPELTDFASRFRNMIAQRKKSAGQSEKGCPYQIPSLTL